MNLDFPVPFDLLKPVIEKSNAKIMEKLEEYNPVNKF